MSDTTNASDELGLGALDSAYTIVGEVRGTQARRTFLAMRLADGAEVLVSVLSAAEVGENNALSHFASDTKILSRMRQPGLLQPIEAKWLGAGALAVVSERPSGTNLKQIIASGERIANPRIAALLQAVDGVLVWARENGIVHRGVTLDAVFVDSLSGRLQLSLLPTPISPEGVPDSIADASTIGKLAWSLLAGLPLDGAQSKKSLAELRPDLAQRVVEEVDRMRAEPGDDVHPEVADFLSVIATADVLKVAELELEKQRAEFAELVRVQRETAEAERTAHERYAAEMATKLAGERHEFELDVERQTVILASERAQLAVEREQLAYEVGSLQQRRAADQTPLVVPEDRDRLVWPEADRRAHRGRFVGPAVFAVALILAALAVHFSQPRVTTPSPVAVGRDTVVPTPPSVETRGVPRGGFLAQSAAGTLSPRLNPPSSASSTSSTPAPVANTAPPAAPVILDSAARRARQLRRDSLLKRDSSLHRDSLGFLRPDTLGR